MAGEQELVLLVVREPQRFAVRMHGSRDAVAADVAHAVEAGLVAGPAAVQTGDVPLVGGFGIDVGDVHLVGWVGGIRNWKLGMRD